METAWRSGERFKRSEENDIIVEAKLKALHVIASLLNFEEDLRLEVIDLIAIRSCYADAVF